MTPTSSRLEVLPAHHEPRVKSNEFGEVGDSCSSEKQTFIIFLQPDVSIANLAVYRQSGNGLGA